MNKIFLLFTILAVASVNALRSAKVSTRISTKLNENFGFKFAEDSYANTPSAILGEVNYKEKFVASYKPDALLLGDGSLVNKIRKNRLLALTAESGLLEALEEKGLTLSQVERLLPLIDELELLPLANKNKDLILNVAPLLVDTAFLAIPLVVSLVKTPASTFSTGAAGLLLLSGYEGVIEHSTFLGGLLFLLSVPGFLLGSVLGSIGGAPAVSNAAPVITSSSSPSTSFAPKISAPSRSGPRVSVSSSGGAKNGQRKTIKVPRRK